MKQLLYLSAVFFFLSSVVFGDDNISFIEIEGRVTNISGFPDSLTIDEPLLGPVYYMLSVTNGKSEHILYVKFGKLHYFSFYATGDSTMTLDAWYKVERSFLPTIGKRYKFFCLQSNEVYQKGFATKINGLVVDHKQILN